MHDGCSFQPGRDGRDMKTDDHRRATRILMRVCLNVVKGPEASSFAQNTCAVGKDANYNEPYDNAVTSKMPA